MSDVNLTGYPEPTAVRDAIHVAIFPVIAGDDINVGDFVRWDGEYTFPCERKEAIGIANPFFKNDRRIRKIRKFERFYIFLFPGTVTGMTHHWSLPAVDNLIVQCEDDKRKSESEKWLIDFCSSHDMPSYETTMEQIKERPEDTHNDWFTFSGCDAHCHIPTEFWIHAEIVTGMKFGRAESFSCSC